MEGVLQSSNQSVIKKPDRAKLTSDSPGEVCDVRDSLTAFMRPYPFRDPNNVSIFGEDHNLEL